MLLNACDLERSLGEYPASSCDLEPELLADQSAEFKVTTFWDSKELAALDVLTNAVDRRRFTPSQSYRYTREDLQRALEPNASSAARAQAPDVFQVNGGSDVLRWVIERPGEETAVCPLDRLREAQEWTSSYFEATLAPSSCRGSLFALPVGIHRINVLFYNSEVYARLAARARQSGIVLPPLEGLESADELVSLVRTVSELNAPGAHGAALIPFAMGIKGAAWPLTTLAFENLFLSLGSASYDWLWKGGGGDAEPERAELVREQLRETLRLLRELTSLNAGPHERTWQEALQAVASGDALMTVSGDWGWRQLAELSDAPVTTLPFPGTASLFVYTPDSFAVARVHNKNNGAPVRSFLVDAVADRSTLLEFSGVKQAIPPLQNLSNRELDVLGSEHQRETYRRFQYCARAPADCRLLLAVSGLGPGAGSDPCFDRVADLLALAVTGRASDPDFASRASRCPEQTPGTPDEAEAQLLKLLLVIAGHQFASECGAR